MKQTMTRSIFIKAISPGTRLVFWAALILPPFALLGSWAPDGGLISWIAIGSFLAAALGDAWFSRGRLRGVRVEAPGMIRIFRDREDAIRLRILNEKMAPLNLKLGLVLPREIVSPSPFLETSLPGNVSVSSVYWPCKALKRGRFNLDRCHIETVSALGFWTIRTHVPLRAEIRVYPNLMKEQRQLKGLFLNRDLGMHVRQRIGKGREFEQLRDYLPGDSFEDIYWKATARRRSPVTKMYQIEQSQQIYLIIDASRLSTRAADCVIDRRRRPRDEKDAPDASILDRYITASLIMGLAAEQQGDLFGLLTFDDKINLFLKAGRGKAHFSACRDALYTLEPRTAAPNFEELFTYIGVHLRRRSLLVFLTNLDDPVLSESFIHGVNLISRRHLILVNMFRPLNAWPLFSSSDIHSINGVYQHLMGHALWETMRETSGFLKQRGVGFALLENEKICDQLVTQYMEIKQRQAL
ncbi:MAG: DUF58 domain-containing protein [Desulfobacterales bacterium]|nr:DUF58 domain-containing protein [Desulfobacterales bacterium]